MKLTREQLAVWLAITRYALNDADEFLWPKEVGEQMIEAGFQRIDETGTYWITDEGCAASDLIAPEWGIDPVPVED